MSFVYLIIGFLLLILSRKVLITLLFRLAGPKFTKTLYFLLFFPGVFIHELSHFFAASLLFVPTGKISLFPDEEKMGSVQVAKTDPLRQSLIGLSPIFFGTATIIAIFFFALKLPSQILTPSQLLLLFKNTPNLPWLYLIFSISNTMFASKKDLQSFLGLMVFLFLIISLLYLFNLLHAAFALFLNCALTAANFVAIAYGSTFLINLVFITPLFILTKLSRKPRKL